MLDLLFPGLRIDRSIRALREEFATSSIVAVSMLEDREVIDRVMAEGADGFIAKSLHAEAHRHCALDAVRQGDFVCEMGGGLPAMPAEADGAALTTHQREVLRLLGAGLSNKEIARAPLGISPFTARMHISAVLHALGVNTRAAAAARASSWSPLL